MTVLQPPQPLKAGITAYNLTAEVLLSYSVNGVSDTPYRSPHGGGGFGRHCCVLLPANWTPKLKTNVQWTIGRFTKPLEKRQQLTEADARA